MTGNSALQELFDPCGTAELVSHAGRYSATQLHHGANDWSRALRRSGITRGDRVICALPNGAAFAQLLVAALADGVTLAPVPPTEDVVPLLDTLDARIAIAFDTEHPHVASPARTGGPPGSPMVPRKSTARTDSIAFLMRSSGTSGQSRWIALSETGVLAVLESHLPQLAIDGSRVLCLLPWSHTFGLVLGLLPALLRARRIVTTTEGARDAAAIVAVSRAFDVTHLSMVPLLASRLATLPAGVTLLQSLAGGLVGGAPIDARLSELLRTTQLRVGYGQTEASPGIMLGNPGEFRDAFLGRPVGCDVRIESDGVLAFRGPNVCGGYWENRALQSLDADRWQRTDDLVSIEGGAYIFRGRTTSTFKLSNGRVVLAPQLESRLQQQFSRITDAIVTTDGGRTIDVLYSTHDGLPAAEEDIRRSLGGLGAYLRAAICVNADAWVRTPKGEIDRQALPAAR